MNNKKGAFDFKFMIALMRLSFKCASLYNWSDVNISALWRTHFESKEDAPSYRTLRSWYSRGTKLARLAEGGSVYMLLWLAHADLRAPFVEADGTLAGDIANALRCPEHDSSTGSLVRDNIIPTIAYLSERCPIRLGDILPNDIISALGVSPSRLCCALDASDRLFSALPSNSFRSLPRSADAWESVNTVALAQQQEATHELTPLTPPTPQDIYDTYNTYRVSHSAHSSHFSIGVVRTG
ncbi:hypothetical protein FOMPIDRAFT_1044760 [Fomitopsis schrenkii]|uniref:Uncharacterized protein n=1 Tax=Fomitopsis schrenkii TaxID=2126942 RepID=S8G5B5_FOMSC|nr:hypothetical protein FOMPIDRAFT_1044760 [Fomitopsis schrenkii]